MPLLARSQAPFTARSFASKTSTSSTRDGSRGEKWNDMAAGTALVDATNVFLAPSKSDLWNTKLQNSIFSHNLPHNIPRDGRHGLKARPELNRGHIAPADYQVPRVHLTGESVVISTIAFLDYFCVFLLSFTAPLSHRPGHATRS